MKYNNHLNYRDRKKLRIKTRAIATIAVVVFIGFAAFFYVDFQKSNSKNTEDSITSEKTNSVVTSKISVFKSPFFQFQANENWREVPSESSPNKFLYRSFRSSLLEHELAVYVNQIPNDVMSSRVLPVEIINNNNTSIFKPQIVSEHCLSALTSGGKKIEVEQIIFNKVNFLCHSASNQYNVIVGEINGGTNMTMKRPDGSTAVYSIFYKDLRAVNSSIEINQIVSTFQTR